MNFENFGLESIFDLKYQAIFQNSSPQIFKIFSTDIYDFTSQTFQKKNTLF